MHSKKKTTVHINQNITSTDIENVYICPTKSSFEKILSINAELFAEIAFNTRMHTGIRLAISFFVI